jgi:hypothetical protein
MNPIWSPEAIVDLAALRAYIAQDDPQRRKVLRSISSGMLRRCFPITLKWGGLAEFRARASS